MHTSQSLQSYYDEFYRNGDFTHYPEQVDIALFRSIFSYFCFPAQPLILDAGCGTGVRLARMEKAGAVPVGVDISFEGLHICRDANRHASVIQADITKLPFHDNCFDGIIALGCSVINNNDIGLVSLAREGLRVTKPGGWVIATSISDFSNALKGGWKHEPLEFYRRAITTVECSARLLRFTAPRLAAYSKKLVMHPAVSAVFSRIPGIHRTIIMAWQK